MPFVDAIKRLADDPRVVLKARAESMELLVSRDALLVRITVAPAALEWFIDVTDESTGSKASDWCDYTGYDRTPRPELEASLMEDLSAFLQGVLDRPLRFRAQRPGLEWEVDGCWRQAVPISISG